MKVGVWRIGTVHDSEGMGVSMRLSKIVEVYMGYDNRPSGGRYHNLIS